MPTRVAVAPVQRHMVEPSQAPTAPTASAAPGTEDVRGPDVTVSRHLDSAQPATEPLTQGFTEVPLVVARHSARQDAQESMRPEVAVEASAALWDHPSPSDSGQPAGSVNGPLGTAVPVEPWAPQPAPSRPSEGPGIGGTTRVASPIARVQRRVAATSLDQPAEPSVQFPQTARSFTPTQAQPPLVVARQVGPPRSPERSPRPGEGMSFASMFSAAGLGAADPDPEDALIGLQRQTEDSGATAAGASASTDLSSAPAPAAAAAAPSAAGSAANFDEMARRLYEPLAARLREELWLDRERAGMISDA
ncbi:MAG: hypothetical protein IPL43_13560 [Micropruina sp.]|nr:hypothetical protein [Micropruina sp.]